VFSGVAKTVIEIERALEVGVRCFNVESASELSRIEAVARSVGKQAPISIRVNPNVDAKTHPYISTGLKENKFGVDMSDALNLYQQAQNSKYLNVQGLDCHIGSQITEVAPFLDALDKVLLLLEQLKDKGIDITHLDLGGGVGIDYEGASILLSSEADSTLKQRTPTSSARSISITVFATPENTH
jgi:diaminopimelate decarboxylase